MEDKAIIEQQQQTLEEDPHFQMLAIRPMRRWRISGTSWKSSSRRSRWQVNSPELHSASTAAQPPTCPIMVLCALPHRRDPCESSM